jgi:hypothetical protein
LRKLLPLVFLLTSCTRYVFVHDKYPIIPKPDRPQEVTVDSLKVYSMKLEVGIDGYNKYAKDRNSEFEKSLSK